MTGRNLSKNRHNTEKQIENYSGVRTIFRRLWNNKSNTQTNGLTAFKRINHNNNPKFVYDNSDYTRFLKQRALKRDYKV
jgi:hypothetical protein